MTYRDHEFKDTEGGTILIYSRLAGPHPLLVEHVSYTKGDKQSQQAAYAEAKRRVDLREERMRIGPGSTIPTDLLVLKKRVQWEYQIIRMFSTNWATIQDSLTRRGEEGWELVSVVGRTHYFKREKIDEHTDSKE